MNILWNGNKGETMNASVLLDACLSSGIDFFTGVPDSRLKGLCDELYSRWGASGQNHIVAHNEGGAVGLCAGHYLATGRPALCYMQNSGLGNAVNPLASLMDPMVYGLPCLLVIGWRGEPGIHDEPQHVRQGLITPDLLKTLDIPFYILSAETTQEEFGIAFQSLLSHLENGRCAALLVRKGALVSAAKPVYGNAFTISREAAVEHLLSLTEEQDIIVSTTGKLSREIFEIRERCAAGHGRDFLTVGSMGHASMIALGIAREKTDRRVWCLDGDGAMLMHLGALEVIGQAAPKNLFHVVFFNGAHETVGGMPVCAASPDFCSLAKTAGYRAALSADSFEGISGAVTSLRMGDGPCLLEIKCACGARKDLGRPTASPIQNRDDFMTFLRDRNGS